MFNKTLYALPVLALVSTSTCLASNDGFTDEERAFLGLQATAPQQQDPELAQVLEASRQAAEADLNRVLERSRQEADAEAQLRAALEQSQLDALQQSPSGDALSEEQQILIATQMSQLAAQESIDDELAVIAALEASSSGNDVDAETLAQIAALEQGVNLRAKQPATMDKDGLLAVYTNLRDSLEMIEAEIADKKKFPLSFQQYKALVQAMRQDPQTMKDELALNAMKKSAAKAAELKALMDRRAEWANQCAQMERQLDALMPKPSYGANNNNNNEDYLNNNNNVSNNNNNNAPAHPVVEPKAPEAPAVTVPATGPMSNAEVIQATDAEYKISLQRDSYRTITAKLEELEAQIQPTRTAIANIDSTIPALEAEVADLEAAYNQTYGGDRVQGHNFGLKQRLNYKREQLDTLRMLTSELNAAEVRLAALRAQKAELEKQMQDKK